MADQKHLHILEQGVEQWNTWRAGHKEIRPDLSGAELICYDLSGAHLNHADLNGANLSQANLSQANLNHADLSHADLYRANPSYADLGGANLSGAHLVEAYLTSADLQRANLSGADLSHATFMHANLSGANLSGANLSGADFGYADLSDTNLSDANLSDANLIGAYLGGAITQSMQKRLGKVLHDGVYDFTDPGYPIYIRKCDLFLQWYKDGKIAIATNTLSKVSIVNDAEKLAASIIKDFFIQPDSCIFVLHMPAIPGRGGYDEHWIQVDFTWKQYEDGKKWAVDPQWHHFELQKRPDGSYQALFLNVHGSGLEQDKEDMIARALEAYFQRPM